MMERIERDFLHEGAPDYKTEYPQFNEAYEELKRLSKSDGGQMDKDAHAALRRMWEKAHPEGAAKE